MPNFVVVTAFKSKDQMSADMKKMGMSAKNFGKIAGVSFRKATTSALSFKKVIGGILGAAILRRGFGALTQGVRTVAEEFVAFDDSITAAATKFGVFDRESETFKDLAKTAREVGAITEFTAPQAAEGLRFLAKAGWTAGQSMKALPSFVDLATASEMEFSRAADIATDVLGQYGLAVVNPTKRLENLTMVNDVLSKAVNMSNIDLENLFETFTYAAPQALKAGISIQKLGAMVAYMGGAGVKGSRAGTALRTMILSLADPTDGVRRKLKKWGISLRDSKKNMRDPIKILQQLSEKFKTMGNTEQIAMAKLMFGKHAVTGATISLDGASGALQKFEAALDAAGGTSKKMSDFMRTSLENRLEALKSGAIELGFKILDAFGKKFPQGIEEMTQAVRKFDVKPIVQGIRDTVSALREIRDIVRSSIEFIREYKGLILGIGAAFAVMKIGSVAIAFGKIATVVGLMLQGGGIAGALATVGVSATLGVIALAIGGIAAGIITVYDNWDDLMIVWRESMEEMDKSFKSLGNSISDYFSGVWQGLKNDLASILTTVVSVAKSIGLGRFISADALNLIKQLQSSGGVTGDWSGPATPADVGAAAATGGMYADPYGLGAGNNSEHGAGASGGWGGGKAFAESPKSDAALIEQQSSQAKADRVYFDGKLDITGAPEGSTYTQKAKPAPGIQGRLLGKNP